MSQTTKRKRMWVVLSMLSLVLAVSLGLFASGGASANVPAGLPASTADSPAAQKDAAFNCAQASALNLDKQMNSHAAQLLAQCGKTSKSPPAAPGSSGSTAGGNLG